MPKQTFYNLSLDKQNKIIDAAKKEFSEFNFYDASINRIIKDAGIPRGSFYQYFENKEDLFIYLLDSSMSIISKKTSERITNNNIDVFEMCLLIFDILTSDDFEGIHRDFIKTTVSNMNIKMMTHFKKFIVDEECAKKKTELDNLVNLSNLNLSSENEILGLVVLLSNTMVLHLGLYFNNHASLKTCREDLIFHINIIKNGLQKK